MLEPALCYAEYVGVIPAACSAYTYSYAVKGEGAKQIYLSGGM
ncbi:hypothetical protein [Peribacillus simplex]